MGKINEHKEGIIFTIIFHLILLLIILNSAFFTPLPLPEEKGFLIDFGNTEEGMGETEPMPQNVLSTSKSQPEATQPPIVKSEPNVPVENKSKAEELITQDFEKTAALEEARKKREEKKNEQIEKLRKADSLQRIENARIAELRRIAEIKRQDSLKKVAEQARIDKINSRAKDVFGGTSGQGTDPNSSGQGSSNKSGNQGSPDGIAGGGQNGTGTGIGDGSGTGKGTGVSFNLSGRSAKTLPKPSYPGNEEGIVVVEVTVDKNGKVTKSEFVLKGSTSLNTGLIEAAKKAAMITLFDSNAEAPELQKGTITYRFVLD